MQRISSLNHHTVGREERNLGLFNFHIREFYTTLISINELPDVNIEELGLAFKDINFGAQLLAP